MEIILSFNSSFHRSQPKDESILEAYRNAANPDTKDWNQHSQHKNPSQAACFCSMPEIAGVLAGLSLQYISCTGIA